MTFIRICKSLLQGKTLVRTVLELRLAQECLEGKVIDLGSGGGDRYSREIPRAQGTTVEPFDQKSGAETNFEIDALPFPDNTYDTILFLNVLEHIFNHQHILREIYRVKSPDGTLIGFVPFLKWYHPDPHDFFRYTDETLYRLLELAGFERVSVEPLYIGPYSTAFDMILPTLPKFIRPLIFTPCYLLDQLFACFRPQSARRYALGYYFKVN